MFPTTLTVMVLAGRMAAAPTMRTLYAERYGAPDVLRFRRRPIPQPAASEVRIGIRAAGVTASDIFIRSGEVGPRLQIPFRLMMGSTKPRQCMPETDSRLTGCLALKPAELGHEEATAAAYGGLLAVQYLDRGGLRTGDSVLIYGASGTSGTFAVQYAKHKGAQVTAVCSGENAELARSLGADEVLDYTTTDAPPADARYDLVLDSVGGLKSSPLKQACRRALTTSGRWVSIDDGDLELDSARLEQVTALVESGAVAPVLSRRYGFEEIAEAHRHVQHGHKRGGVAISIAAGE
ncbi:MAG TPA: NAD(P)-dependent alcohol dehydrogenase [Propionicimonas sp.]|nr:NAD(P)-dependent alcohol dehydrogenase [Propionicimonas sp.]